MQTATKALPFLSILDGLSKHYGKRYCYPSQKKYLELLGERLGVFMSIAALNRHLRVIEDSGFIKRTRRIRYDRVKGMIFKSTLYEICSKGFKLLRRFGVKVYQKIRESNGSPRGKSKKGVVDPDEPFLVSGGKSYWEYLKNGGKRPSFK